MNKIKAAHYIGQVQVIVTGAMAVFYFGRLIALVDGGGNVLWRDQDYPLFLVEYLIENPPAQHEWN